jgi:hypothetical protein
VEYPLLFDIDSLRDVLEAGRWSRRNENPCALEAALHRGAFEEPGLVLELRPELCFVASPISTGASFAASLLQTGELDVAAEIQIEGRCAPLQVCIEVTLRGPIAMASLMPPAF